jgi:hypothetical protein
MNKNFFETLFGNGISEKSEKLEQSLLLIEEKHIEFFKSRPPKFEGELHDRLHNHWLMWEENSIIKFGFDKDSTLPPSIQNECINCFKEIYNP